MSFTVGRVRKTDNGYYCDIEPIDTSLSIFIPTCSELTVSNIRAKWEQFGKTNGTESSLEFSDSAIEFIDNEHENAKYLFGFAPVIAHAKIIDHAMITCNEHDMEEEGAKEK